MTVHLAVEGSLLPMIPRMPTTETKDQIVQQFRGNTGADAGNHKVDFIDELGFFWHGSHL